MTCYILDVAHKETNWFVLDGGKWGNRNGAIKKCKFPYFVTKMQLLIEPYKEKWYQPSRHGKYVRADNSALNAIRLTCSDGTVLESGDLTRTTNWLGAKECGSGGYINGAIVRKEEYNGGGYLYYNDDDNL
mgnify:CR=1 FL=1